MTDAPQPPSPPSPETIRRAQLFWQQSGDDLRAAKRSLRQGSTHPSCFLSLQAAVNGLSAVCQLRGRFQLPATASELLAIAGDSRFAALTGECPGLDSVADQNPFAPGRVAEDEAALGEQCLAESRAVLAAVKGYLKENRERYFAP